MATRDTTTPASTPPSPSPRADAAPSDSETPGRSPDVVDITGGEEPWTASAARSTSDPPPLRTSKRAAARAATSTVSVEARKGKKKVPGRPSTAASVSSSSKKGSVDSGSAGPKKRAEHTGLETDPDAEGKAAFPRAKRAKKSPAPAPSSSARTPAPAMKSSRERVKSYTDRHFVKENLPQRVNSATGEGSEQHASGANVPHLCATDVQSPLTKQSESTIQSRNAIQQHLTIQSGSTIQSPNAIQQPLTIQSGSTIQSPNPTFDYTVRVDHTVTQCYTATINYSA
ncbi:hypothetical protein DVH05_025986 [Phytophthora capsici]|nr:hypothetical protein DVH05_025986 [Phytophthora capsici]